VNSPQPVWAYRGSYPSRWWISGCDKL